jgi:hypothetical protein
MPEFSVGFQRVLRGGGALRHGDECYFTTQRMSRTFADP